MHNPRGTGRLTLAALILACAMQPVAADSSSAQPRGQANARVTGVGAIPACSNKTLKGTYSLSMTGSLKAGDAYIPEAYAGFVSYDGLGNILLKKTSFTGGQWKTLVSTGTYQIDRSCTGVATYPTSRFQYYVAPDGSSLTFVKTSTLVDGQFVDTQDRLASTVVRISPQALVRQ